MPMLKVISFYFDFINFVFNVEHLANAWFFVKTRRGQSYNS